MPTSKSGAHPRTCSILEHFLLDSYLIIILDVDYPTIIFDDLILDVPAIAWSSLSIGDDLDVPTTAWLALCNW